MKPTKNLKFLLAATLLTAPFAQAATFHWDGGTANNPAAGDGVSQGGAGNWSTAISNWDVGASPHVVWPGSGTDNDAVFGGTAGTVTLTSSISANDITFNTTGYTIARTGTGTTNVLTLNGTTPTITTGTDINATISARIGGTAGMTKAGAGTLTLTSNETNYTGTTTISSGTLALAMTGNSTFASAVTVNGGTTLEVRSNDAAGNRLGSIPSISLIGTLTYNPANSVHTVIGNSAGTLGKVTVSGGASVINLSPTVANTAGSGGLFLDAGLGGSTALTVNATRDGYGLVLRQALNTYSGTMIVNGTASTAPGIGSGLALGQVGTSMANASLTINGTLELGNQSTGMGWATTPGTGTSVSINALNGTGVVVANMQATNTRTLIVGSANGTGSFSGVIANGNNNTLSLTKIGTGTQTLSGTNTYTGATTVSAGVLAVNGTLANTSTTVSSTTSARLQGSGSTAGSVSVGTNGTIGAGNSIESLGVGSLALTNGSTFEHEMSDNSATGADLVFSAGNLSLAGTVTLNLIDLGSYIWQAGDKITLISYSGILAANSLFSYADGNDGLLQDDEIFSYDGIQWAFNYNDTLEGTNYTSDSSGTFVTMTALAAIPEPNTALLGALGVLALLRRRR